MKQMKRYFICVDVAPGMADPGQPATYVRVQLKDNRGTRPGPRPATLNHPARVYVKNYKNALAGVRHFDRYRDELERLVN